MTPPIPPPDWQPPESPIVTGPLAAELEPFVKAMERRAERKCADCGAIFEAVGLTAYCDPCGIKVDEAAATPPVRKLDSSWPRLHAEKLDAMIPCACPTPPPSQKRQRCATCMAIELAPKLFGNRLLVLAGDRGRGKTQIATFIAYHRMTKGHDCGIYTRAYDMHRLCSSFDADSRKALLAFQRVPFLAIDEMHRVEPKHLHVIESVLDERYANKRPTMLIGNWMTEAGMLAGETVSGERLNGLGPTVMDRINEHTANRTGGVVWCRWESYRK